eukprot:COSAG01_NODE_6992_length_3401_cov_1.741672_3_plen_52_part_00
MCRAYVLMCGALARPQIDRKLYFGPEKGSELYGLTIGRLATEVEKVYSVYA